MNVDLHGDGPCALCGRDPAAGFASIGDDWYCHGDDDPEPTCYTRAVWARAKAAAPPERDPRDVYAIHVWRGPVEGLVELCTAETPEGVGAAIVQQAADAGGRLDGLLGVRHIPDHRWIVNPFPRTAPANRP